MLNLEIKLRRTDILIIVSFPICEHGLLFHLFSFLFNSSEFWNFLPTALVNILLDLYSIPFFGGEGYANVNNTVF